MPRRKRDSGEPITKKKEYVVNRRDIFVPYIKSIKALAASQSVIGEGTGFQTSRHPYKMTKVGKYGKLTIDVPQLVEKHVPTFYNDAEDLLSLLELIIGSIDVGNDNSKMKNRGMAILDQLLKLGAISKDQHEKLYIEY